MGSVRGDGAGETIAVVGLSCRLPQAPDEKAFWTLLSEGRCAVGRLPARRVAQLGLTGPASERPGGYLDAIDGFDAEFFGVSRREAAAMDPQQRLALELAWEAVEDAGIPRAALRGSRSAVLMAAIWGDYPNGAWDADGAPRQAFAGSLRSMLANRVSYLFDLRGPSLAVDSGQSSSLLAVHQACAMLRAGECDLALAGGVNLIAGRHSALVAESFGGLSDSGLCRAFDAAADGYVRGEGGGVVVLKRLADAVGAGDPVRAVILGSAAGSGGAGAAADGVSGLTVPGVHAQREVIIQACAQAGIDPGRVRYVEAHGTGTRVGDPVEARALGEAYGSGRAAGGPLLVGSVKTNVGHLEGAAGIIGLVKAVLAIEHAAVPASLHFTEPNPLIDFGGLGISVPSRLRAWQPEDGPLVCAVSAFGVGGTNCHAILGPAPDAAAEPGVGSPRDTPADEDAVLAFPVTAHTRAALSAQAGRLRAYLDEGERPRRDSLAQALASRSLFERRAVVVAGDDARLDRALGALAAGEPAAGLVEGTASADPRPVFVFPGQGAQWPGMAVELARSSAAFRDALDECVAALEPYTGGHLANVLADASGRLSLDRADVVQPAQFAVMVALARLWEHHGVRPRAVLGHSQGEIAAAYIAGRLSLEDAALIVCRRGHALRRIEGRGGMAAVDAPEEQVRALMSELAASGAGSGTAGPVVHLAARNGPASCVVSGGHEALDAFERCCADEGVRVRRVPVDFPSHSPFVEEVRAELIEAFASLRPRPEGEIAFYSSLLGGPAGDRDLDAEYWYRNLREPVDFAGAVAAAAADGHSLFIESSPHPVLAGSIGAAGDHPLVAVGTLRRADGGMERFLTSLATAFVHGADVDWTGGERPAGRAGRLRLPGYAFQRRPYWADAGTSASASIPALEARPRNPIPAAAHTQEPETKSGPMTGRPLLGLVAAHTAAVLGYGSPDEVEVDRLFKDLGFDSPAVVDLAARLAGATGLSLTASFVFDHPTPRRAAAGLDALLSKSEQAGPANATATRSDAADLSHEPIAIVGMGIRLPGGIHGPDEFWDLLMQERDVIGPLPADRGWDLARVYHPDPDHPGTSYTRYGGFLDDVAGFDAEFFGISPREALAMDPQQRLLLEVTWEALEHAGIDPLTLRGTDTNVYTGIMASDYGPGMTQAPADLGGFMLTGNAGSVASGRVAYVLGLGGGAVSVDTACSSSLVALHVGVGVLRGGGCSRVVVGGVAVMSSAGLLVEFSRARGLSVDGRCGSFGEGASGTGWSEGCGVLVLERLSDAVLAGRRVLAVVRGSAVNQDGASNGLTAPSGVAQVGVLRGALCDAGLGVEGVDVVEGHGTGTVLGDPVEVGALSAVFGGGGLGSGVLLGSVKSVVGHVQAAAGVVGVVKMVLGLGCGVVPGSLGGVGSSRVVWEGVELVSGARVWPDRGRVRRAGVSSFGISGTNAHVILEQAPPSEVPEPAVDEAAQSTATPMVWPLSARTPAALAAMASRLIRHLDRNPALSAGSVAAGLARRSRFAHRAAIHADHATALAALAEGHPAPGLAVGEVTERRGGRQGQGLVFIFPGQGSQYPDMAREVFETSPAFRRHIERCADALAAYTDWSLLDLWRGPGLDLDRPDVVQPVLFAVNTGLAEFWREHGISPSAVIGHSQGEIAAAYCAGVLSLEDAALLAARRSALVARRLSGRGGMASLAAGERRAADLIAPWTGQLHVAAYNGPESTVVAGESAALAQLAAACDEAGVRLRRIAVDYASHGPQIDELEEELLAELSGLAPRAGHTAFYSTVEGALVDGAGLDAAYWQRNLRSPVLFAQTVALAAEAGYDGFVEVSPHPVLVPAIAEGVDGIPVVPTLRRDARGPGAALASAFVHGLPVQWPERAEEPADLPPYPFQHTRYWLAPPRDPREPMVDPGDAGGDLYILEWEPAAQPESGPGAIRRGTPIAVFDVVPRVDDDADPARDARISVHEILMRVRAHLADPHSGVLAVATRGAVAVRPGDAIAREALAGAAVWGLVRAAQREEPGRLLLIDIDAADGGRTSAEELAEAALISGHDQIAVRDGQIFVPRLRVRADAGGPATSNEARRMPRLTPGGTVLITGGTGALGALTACYLAEQAAVRNLLLLSRQGPDAPGAAELLRRLAGAGAEAKIVSCDAADAGQLRGVLDAVDPEHPLCAVIHTAGVLDDAMLADLTPDRLDAAMRPKADAAWNLHELTAHLPLDAFVLYSSVMGVLGNAGQANYCAANAFLDGLAQHRRAAGLPAVSIAWGFWSRAGAMTGGLSEADRSRLARLGLVALADERGMELLRRALAEDVDAVLIAAGMDVLTLVEQRAAGLLPPALRGLLPEETGHRPSRRGREAAPDRTLRADESSAHDAAPEADANPFAAMSAQERREAVEDLVRRHVAAALGHPDPRGLPMDRGLAELGLTSMAGLELRTRLASALGAALPSTLIFDHPTAQAVVEYADALLAQAAAVDTAPSRAASRALDELAGLVPALLGSGRAAGAFGAPGQAEAMGRRLRELAALLEPVSPPASTAHDSAPGPAAAARDELDAQIAAAGSGELIALLDRELAGALVPDHDVEGG